jgi:phosphomannomutase/phosphoglucomutase
MVMRTWQLVVLLGFVITMDMALIAINRQRAALRKDTEQLNSDLERVDHSLERVQNKFEAIQRDVETLQHNFQDIHGPRWQCVPGMVADAGNGTAGPVMHQLFKRLNCEVTELFFDMDGRFPNHHPDPTVPANLKQLQEAVRSQKADLGIAFDGDADRIGAIDENGEVIYGDMLLLIYGREILARKPGATFIGEVKCSQVLYDELKRLGGNPIMYRTGHSLIKAKMKLEHAELAGEMSGHMFFADRYFGYDDALYAACRLIEIVSKSGRPLSAQFDGLPKMVSTPEIRVDCPDETKFQVVERMAAHFRHTHRVIEIDGVRILFDQGWGLVRASNTQPVLVLRFEAQQQSLLEKYRAEVEGILEQARRATA